MSKVIGAILELCLQRAQTVISMHGSRLIPEMPDSIAGCTVGKENHGWRCTSSVNKLVATVIVEQIPVFHMGMAFEIRGSQQQ